jgi:hypothetical protein
MSNGVHISGPIGFMEQSGSAVYFSKTNDTAGTFKKEGFSTCVPVRKAQNALDIAYWGEDNRFPQNIENQMSYCGIGKAALDWKARILFGGGIIPGKVTGYEDEGKKELFEPLDRIKYKTVYDFLENRRMFRFWMEYLQDWVWFANCFPEVVLTKDGSKISHFVHQESSDARYKNMNENGQIDTVYLSKMWGMAKDQFAKFDPDKKVLGLLENPKTLSEIDNKFLKTLDCIDMYNPLQSLTSIAEKLNNTRSKSALKSAILPVNYPSVNKTYYQVATWDGARLGGWIEIACKIPAIFKMLFSKAFRIKYHIEIPMSYFETKYTYEVWHAKTEEEQKNARIELLTDMDAYLSGDTKAFSTFVSFFDVDTHTKTEFGRIKITPIEEKSNLDKEILMSSAADVQILTAMQVHPTLSGAGTVGTGSQRTGGSDQREAFLIYTSALNLERQVALEPIYLARDFNKWGDDIHFRIRDTQLTTLNQNTGTQKVVS